MSEKLKASIFMLDDITSRARAMGLGLVAYPVDDVERVLAVLKPGIVAVQPPAQGLEDRLALLLAEILDRPLATFAGGPEPDDKPMELRLHTLRPDLSKRAAELLDEADR